MATEIKTYKGKEYPVEVKGNGTLYLCRKCKRFIFSRKMAEDIANGRTPELPNACGRCKDKTYFM